MPLRFPRAKLVVGGWRPCPSVAAMPRPRPRRWVHLQIRAVREQLDRDPLESLFLMLEIENRLLEVEEKFASIGHEERCMDIQLERARMKRWGNPCAPCPGEAGRCSLPPSPGHASVAPHLAQAWTCTPFHTQPHRCHLRGQELPTPSSAVTSPDRSHHLPIPNPPPTQGHPTEGSMQGFKTQPANQRPGVTSSLYEGKATRHLGAPS